MMKRQKKGTVFATTLCVAVVWSGITWVTDVNGDYPVVLPDELKGPPPPPLPPKEQERIEWLQKLKGPIPYLVSTKDQQINTFGQASKHCRWAVVGTVEAVEEAKPSASVTFVEGLRVFLAVDTDLYGKIPRKKLAVTIIDPEGYEPENIMRLAKPGDRMLAFLTDRWYSLVHVIDPSPYNPLHFDFDRSKTKWEKSDLYVLSHIILDSKETEQETVKAAKGYLGFFGENGKRDRDKYVEFLCSLLQSPVKRIRDDAENDLVIFFTKEKDPPPDLDKLLADDRVRKEVKDYLRYLLRNEKPK